MDWEPLDVDVLRNDDGVPLDPVDIPWFADFGLVLTSRALDLLSEVLPPNGLPLPLSTHEPMTLFVPPAERALDTIASEVVRFSSGRVMDVRSFAFEPAAVANLTLFRLAELPAGPMFATRPFVKALRASTLSGLDVKLRWSG
jgi:hypothetical protein